MTMSGTRAAARVLTVGTSDPGGRRGIQADIRIMSQLGCFPHAVITGLVAKAPGGYHSRVPVSWQVIGDQIQCLRESSITAAKVGELGTHDAAKVIRHELEACGTEMIVVDPDLAPDEGSAPDPRVARAYRDALLPAATVVTVDLQEAANLLERPVNPADGVRGLVDAGATWVVMKGVHPHAIGAPYEDMVSDGEQWFAVRSELLDVSAKGVGAAFAAALTAYMATGDDVPTAAEKARQFVVEALKEVAGGSRNGNTRE